VYVKVFLEGGRTTAALIDKGDAFIEVRLEEVKE
jgi:hypothetical protein